MKKRLLVISVVLAVLLALTVFATTSVMAANYNKTLAQSVTVLQPQPGLEMYSDTGCTTVMTSVAYGSLYPGQTSTVQTMYVKNTGQIDFTTVQITSGVGSSLGVVAFSTNNFPLTVAQVVQVDFSITLSPTAAPSSYTALNMSLQSTY